MSKNRTPQSCFLSGAFLSACNYYIVSERPRGLGRMVGQLLKSLDILERPKALYIVNQWGVLSPTWFM